MRRAISAIPFEQIQRLESPAGFLARSKASSALWNQVAERLDRALLKSFGPPWNTTLSCKNKNDPRNHTKGRVGS